MFDIKEDTTMERELIIRWINLKIEDLDVERLRWIYYFLCGYLRAKPPKQ